MSVFKNIINNLTKNNQTTLVLENLHSKPVNVLSLGSWQKQGPVTPKEVYRGLSLGIIRRIRDTAIVTAEENVRTTCSTYQKELLAKSGDQIQHPYITLYRNSPYFSEYDFWKKALTWLLLKGEFFLYVNRTKLKNIDTDIPHNIYTHPKYFKLINPYHVQVLRDKHGEISGYKETVDLHNGSQKTRTFKPYEVIHFKEDDPFDDTQVFSIMVDGVQENLVTLKEVRNFCRDALQGSTNAPGIISTDVLLDDASFDNFASRLESHAKGTPIIANGAGSITWNPMSQNLDGTSQERITQINREEMMVTSGAGKSILGVEQSGLTRDVAATQKITFVEATVVPWVKLILETFNTDYRIGYAGDFFLNKYIMRVTVPSTSDKTQELKELEVREKEYEMTTNLVNRGYSQKSAIQYVKGEIDVDGLQLDSDYKQPKLTAKEAKELLESLALQQNLLAKLVEAGNDPQTVIDYIVGNITLEDFLLINKDVKPIDIDVSEDEKEPLKPSEKADPNDYYDPDGDLATPRADKTPKAKKKK